MFRPALILAGCAALAACSTDTPADEAGNETAAAAPTVELSRLDCGTIEVSDLSVFSVAGNYKGVHKTLTDSCYLIRHGETLMLWDTGLPANLKGKKTTDGPFTVGVMRTIAQQLRDLGLSPEDIDYIGISHYHFDHSGQLPAFPRATLLQGSADIDAIRAGKLSASDAAPLAHWIDGDGKVDPVSGDRDIFGDGSVVMLDLPGHTPGHMGLKVVTADKTYLLTGDVAHFYANYDADDVPTRNTDKAVSVESLKRFKGIAEQTGATVVIQHDPADIDLVPAAKASAK